MCTTKKGEDFMSNPPLQVRYCVIYGTCVVFGMFMKPIYRLINVDYASISIRHNYRHFSLKKCFTLAHYQ